MSRAFQSFVKDKAHEVETARIECVSTVFDRGVGVRTCGIGNAWSLTHYGSEFRLVDPDPGQTALSLVFVQSKDGNTGGPDPSALGGGPTDKHLIYEGLSRVAADAVLAGAGSLHAKAFFSVWHPEFVTLRASLGLTRHPAQVVISRRGTLDFTALLFNVPEAPAIVLAGDECLASHASALRVRPWIRHIRLEGDDLRPALQQLRQEHGIRRISAIGGRYTATRLVDQKLAQDIYLTTAARAGGCPGTPWYSGARSPQLTAITEKQWCEGDSTALFQHVLID